MTAALFAKALTLLLLVLCKQGLTEEQKDVQSQEEPESREKRGLNMLRLGRGLQMLRLGKRGLNMLRLGRSSPSSEELSDYLYNLVDKDTYADPESYSEDYMYPEGGRFRRSLDGERAVALPRIGKELEGADYGVDEDEYLKQALESEDGFDGYVPKDEDEKRALSMLRLGKRRMSMLRLGKRPMSMLRLGKRPMNMLRLGKRPMNMLRLGKRPMNMLRLGKRPMNMLRLGKREDQTEGEDKRALGMLRLGKRSSETEQQDASAASSQ